MGKRVEKKHKREKNEFVMKRDTNLKQYPVKRDVFSAAPVPLIPLDSL